MTPDQLAEVEAFFPWCRAVAARMTRPERVDDLAQEGWIAVWRGAEKWKSGNFPGWIRTCARNAMLTVIRDEQHLHHDIRKTDLYGEFPQEFEPALHDKPDLLSYHAVEIATALNDLTDKDRDYVVGRFWRGETSGKHQTTASNRWYKTLRPKLALSLAHLEDAA